MGKQPSKGPFDSLWIDCHLATMEGDNSYGTIRDGAVGVRNGTIVWLGKRKELETDAEETAKKVHRLKGAWVTPGLIDCHTHLVYAGNRSHEFEMRLGGATYEEIAGSGGGILSTVAAVRNASEADLYRHSVKRLKAMQKEGVTTVEIKSGYGLDTASELKMLRVIRRLGVDLPVTVCPTFLGAHTLPPEYRGRADAYVDLVLNEMLPAVVKEGLATAMDVFCDRIAFSLVQTLRLFKAAGQCGLRVKLHAEQLSDQKGTLAATAHHALSVDHLEYLQTDGIETLSGSGTVAVLLPGAFYFLKESRKPPVGELRDAGVPMAVSTDCNPGSSPCTSPLLMMNMACLLFDLTPVEALAGFTRQAARALDIDGRRGSLAVGKVADMAVWDIAEPAELAYRMGGNPCRVTVKEGDIVGAGSLECA